jgi:hypothetical protein
LVVGLTFALAQEGPAERGAADVGEKVFIGIGILLMAMSATFVQLRSNYFNSKLTENQVLHRLSEVDGYIDCKRSPQGGARANLPGPFYRCV